MEDMNDAYMYGDEGFGYIQDADILDRPDLFYGAPGELPVILSTNRETTVSLNVGWSSDVTEGRRRGGLTCQDWALYVLEDEVPSSCDLCHGAFHSFPEQFIKSKDPLDLDLVVSSGESELVFLTPGFARTGCRIRNNVEDVKLAFF